jgi:diamine N-acetyltransferase
VTHDDVLRPAARNQSPKGVDRNGADEENNSMNAEAVTLRLLSGKASEMRELQRVIEGAPRYAHRITGVPPGQADAQSTYTALPEGKTYGDKFVFGICLGSEMVGCADLIRGYPKPATALLGLLLISERWQHRGVGTRAYTLIEELVRTWHTCDRVRIGVVRTNEEVIPFWSRLGFKPSGEVKSYRYGAVASETVILEKTLAFPAT